jgi:hypothetical protein
MITKRYFIKPKLESFARQFIVSRMQHVMNNGAHLAIYCQILVERWANMRIVDCAMGVIPDRGRGDDLQGQTADVRANWQSGDRRPDAHNVELEVTNDAHQELSNGVGGGHRRRRQR